MKSTFEYLRPASVDEAVELKARHGAGAMYWAGGTDLMLDWNRRLVEPDRCIDLTHVPELDHIVVGKHVARIGAMASLADLERAREHPLVAFLGDVAEVMCTPQTRTLATVGGNLCHASPSADLAAPLLVLDAVARVRGARGERTVPLEELFAGVKRTSLEPDELLLEVSFPLDTGRRAAFARVARTVVDIALVIAAASLTVDDGGRIRQARVALGSVATIPFRARDAEELLVGANALALSEELVGDAARRAADAASPIDDVRAGAAYRTEISRVLVRRALREVALKLQAEGFAA